MTISKRREPYIDAPQGFTKAIPSMLSNDYPVCVRKVSYEMERIRKTTVPGIHIGCGAHKLDWKTS